MKAVAADRLRHGPASGTPCWGEAAVRALRAIALETWFRSGRSFISLVAAVGLVTPVVWGIARWSSESLARSAGYAALIAALIGGFRLFHFTEGQKRAGFGTFPRRWFSLPAPTWCLVAAPMLYGAAAILVIYIGGTLVVFSPFGAEGPSVGSSLYVLAGFVWGQAIVWAFASRPRLKLFFLSFAGGALLIGWMFLAPEIIEGALAEVGYPGDARSFQARLAILLALAAPAAYGFGTWQVGRQRRGEGLGKRRFAWAGLRAFALTRPFASPLGALIWHEWRRSGLILPGCVVAVLILTLAPSLAFGELSGSSTLGLAQWGLLSPLLLALVVGRGFTKPDFWRGSLDLPAITQNPPARSGEWVAAKLIAAAISALVAWTATLIGVFVWAAHAADFGAFQDIAREWAFRHREAGPWRVFLISLSAAIIGTFSALIWGIAIGLSGRRWAYYLLNGVVSVFLGGLFVFLIWDGNPKKPSGRLLPALWPWLTPTIALLGLYVMSKACVGAWCWKEVHRRRLLNPVPLWICVIAFASTQAFLAWGVAITAPWADYLRSGAMLIAMGAAPWSGPPMAILAWAANRAR